MLSSKTIRIFISSTFRDMDFERDVIKFKVIPRLNVRYRHAGLSFQAIDLRIGVNTSAVPEDQRENKVLDVCLDCIDQARPFFIGLIGSRYGWVPSPSRFEHVLRRLAATKHPLISGAVGRSVTELEILYGAIGGKGEYIDNSLFFFRDARSYHGMDEDTVAAYTDLEPAQALKLEELKERILKATSDSAFRPTVYRLEWDGDHENFRDVGNAFANEVYEQLARLADKIVSEQQVPKVWHSQLNEADLNLLRSYAADVAPRRRQVQELAEKLTEGSRIILTGESGSGKSVMLSLVAQHLQEQTDACLLTMMVGENAQSYSPVTTLARWINTLAESLGQSLPFADEADANPHKAVQLSTRLEQMARQRDLRPIVLIDGVDLLALHDAEAAYLSWLPQSFALLATSGYGHVSASDIHGDIAVKPITAMSNADVCEYLRYWERHNSNELGARITREIEQCYGNPRRLGLLMKLVGLFSTDDFRNIRSTEADDEMAKITAYVSTQIADAPTDNVELIHNLLRRATTEYAAPHTLKHAIDLIALSQSGLRDSDIESMLGKEFNMLDFVTLTSLLDQTFYDDSIYHRRTFKSPALARQYAAEIGDPSQIFAELARHTAGLDPSDPLRRDMLLFYALSSGDARLIAANLLFAPQRSSIKEEASAYYATSVQYLLAQSFDCFFNKVAAMAWKLNVAERIDFLYNIFFRGFPQLGMRINVIKHFAEIIFDIPTQEITSAASAYALAWMQNEVVSAKTYRANPSPEELIRMYAITLRHFELSHRLDPEMGDSANLIIATASQLMTLYAQIGDFDAMDNILNNYLTNI